MSSLESLSLLSSITETDKYVSFGSCDSANADIVIIDQGDKAWGSKLTDMVTNLLSERPTLLALPSRFFDAGHKVTGWEHPCISKFEQMEKVRLIGWKCLNDDNIEDEIDAFYEKMSKCTTAFHAMEAEIEKACKLSEEVADIDFSFLDDDSEQAHFYRVMDMAPKEIQEGAKDIATYIRTAIFTKSMNATQLSEYMRNEFYEPCKSLFKTEFAVMLEKFNELTKANFSNLIKLVNKHKEITYKNECLVIVLDRFYSGPIQHWIVQNIAYSFFMASLLPHKFYYINTKNTGEDEDVQVEDTGVVEKAETVSGVLAVSASEPGSSPLEALKPSTESTPEESPASLSLSSVHTESPLSSVDQSDLVVIGRRIELRGEKEEKKEKKE